jgi:hypothetical protein
VKTQDPAEKHVRTLYKEHKGVVAAAETACFVMFERKDAQNEREIMKAYQVSGSSQTTILERANTHELHEDNAGALPKSKLRVNW